VYGTIAVTAAAATYLTGGLVMDFSGKVPGCRKAPLWVQVQGINGFWYSVNLGTSISTPKLLIYVATSVGAGGLPQTEILASAAIPAGVSGDTINFVAHFDALQ
jgi:hypothetical protein